MSSLFKKFSLKTAMVATLVGAFASAIPANASIVFDGSGTIVFQQTQNSPCVIGNNSCNQPAGFTSFQDPNGAGGGGTYDFTSPVYQAISPFVAPGSYNGNKIPTAFTIGIDENIAAGQGAETLVFFRTLICTDATGTSCSIDAANSYQPGSPTTIPNINNGNGFSDALLTGFTLNQNSFYKFEASVGNDTDGMEQFFIVPQGTPPTVPEPASLFLLGAGMSALGILRFRKGRQ
jgi:hypothetical protein